MSAAMITNAGNNQSGRSVLGTNSEVAQPTAPAAEPSIEGWKISGLSWYWWLAILTGIWLLLAALMRRLRGSKV